MECRTEQQFHPHLPKQMFPKARHKLGISITNNKLWHPTIHNPHIKQQLSLIKSCGNYCSWNHLCQLGESIDFHEYGVHPIPLGQLGS
jgi:hypothetical protein